MTNLGAHLDITHSADHLLSYSIPYKRQSFHTHNVPSFLHDGKLLYNNPDQSLPNVSHIADKSYTFVNYPPTPKAMGWASCFSDKGNPSSPQA